MLGPIVVCDSETCRWRSPTPPKPAIHPVELLAAAYGYFGAIRQLYVKFPSLRCYNLFDLRDPRPGRFNLGSMHSF
jgi:hypothetical protein